MPKGTQGNRRTTTKIIPSGNRGKNRRKQRATNRPVTTLTSKQREAPAKVVSPNPIVSPPVPNTKQIAPQPHEPHVLSDLKRIGIIAGAMLLILIILYLVL